MFKEEVYNKVISLINLNTQGIVVAGGYDIVFYRDQVGNPIPYVINQTSSNKFVWTREPIIPMSEEYSNETPSVNLSDRSDYVTQYQFMCQVEHLTKLKAALEEFRDAIFVAQKYTIDGYTVSFKTTRGDKQPSVRMEGGNIFCFYKISINFTAVKNGYMISSADKWEIRLRPIIAGSFVVGKLYQIVSVGTTNFTLIGASANVVGNVFTATGVGTGTGTAVMTNSVLVAPTTYLTLKTITDTVGTTGNVSESTSGSVALGLLTNTTLASTLEIINNGEVMESQIYKAIMNKLQINTLFDLKHTFNGVTYSYVIIINGGGRTQTPNGLSILEFSWREADE